MELTMPRLFTPPLRDLDEPGATWGHDFAWFCREILRNPLSDYQEWLGLHALEVLEEEKAREFAMLEDDPTDELEKVRHLYSSPKVKGGRPIPGGMLRFTYVLILISRQNGKTDFVKKLIKYFFFRRRVPEIMAAAQTLNKAIDLWNEILLEIELDPLLSRSLGRVDRSKGAQAAWSRDRRRRYRPVGIDENAGRGDTVDLLYIDELRTQKSYVGVNALEATTTATDNGLIVVTSNAGGPHSIALRETRQRALKPIQDDTWHETRIGLFEWSAEPSRSIDDIEGWCEANPDLNHGRITIATLQGFHQSKTEAAFRTEHLCQWADDFDTDEFVPVVDVAQWDRLAVADAVRVGRCVLAVEVGPDGKSWALVVAGQTKRGAHLQLLHKGGDFTVERGVAAVLDFCRQWSPSSVVLDKAFNTGVLVAPLLQAGVEPVALTGAGVSAAWRVFEQSVKDGTVTHDVSRVWGDELSCARLHGEGKQYPSLSRGSGDIPALVGATLAVWGLAEFLTGFAAGQRKAFEEKKMNPVGVLPVFSVKGGDVHG